MYKAAYLILLYKKNMLVKLLAESKIVFSNKNIEIQHLVIKYSKNSETTSNIKDLVIFSSRPCSFSSIIVSPT